MTDKEKGTTHRERLSNILKSEGKGCTSDAPNDELSCSAFGCLRGGTRDSSASLEFRLRDGNSIWFPYAQLGAWQYNPSEGLLLKFSSDVVYLVLIRGSNLDKPLSAETSINLTRGGLQRNRIL